MPCDSRQQISFEYPTVAPRSSTQRVRRRCYVEKAWRIVDPVLGKGTPLHDYEPQRWGPATVEELAPAGGWRNPVTDHDPAKGARAA